MVRDFSVLGSTATATLCKAEKTGKIVMIAAGGKRGLGGPVVGFEIRKTVSRLAGIPGVMSNVACVELCGRTRAHAPRAASVCSSRGVGTAVSNIGPCVCPGVS